jgi:cysteine desulfurase
VSESSSLAGNPAIYLDWNATTPLHPEVVAAMQQCAAEAWGNPSSVHRFGRLARERVEQARATMARHFAAHPRDLLFVSGGTEANNLAVLDAPALVTSELEHPSITRVAREFERKQRPVRWMAVRSNGQVALESLEQCLDGLPPGAVVTLQAVNHETGVIQPLSAAAPLVHRALAWLHVDAVQAFGKLDPATYLHGDSYSVAAHKIRGPKGIGALVWRCGRPAPQPLMFGGAQQRGFRPGTFDSVAVAGFESAFTLANAAMSSRSVLGSMRDELEAALAPIGASNTREAPRMEHVVSWFLPGWRGDELVAALDVEGLCISSGSACSAGTAEPSPVIQAMHGTERAVGTIRITLGETTTRAEIDRAAAIIRRVVARVALAGPEPGAPSSDA